MITSGSFFMRQTTGGDRGRENVSNEPVVSLCLCAQCLFGCGRRTGEARCVAARHTFVWPYLAHVDFCVAVARLLLVRSSLFPPSSPQPRSLTVSASALPCSPSLSPPCLSSFLTRSLSHIFCSLYLTAFSSKANLSYGTSDVPLLVFLSDSIMSNYDLGFLCLRL